VDKLGVSLPWLITQAVNFLVVLFILQRFAYKPLIGMMEKRKNEISGALANAEKVRQDIVAKANEEAAQIKAKAMTDADYERKQALAQLQGEIANLSLAVTRKVLGGGGLDEAHHRQLVQQFLSELEGA